jgi:hypothetical protein
MPDSILKRGAFSSPRHKLAAALPHVPLATIPPNFLRFPRQLSMWLNDRYGDCVSAEEAFAKACNIPEIFIPDSEVLSWAGAGGFLNGADLITVLEAMQKDGFRVGGQTYNDGNHNSVNWVDAPTLQSAIYSGPVKIGVAADQLEAVVQNYGVANGWFATGFQPDANLDHCVSLCGYGTAAWLAEQLGVRTPANAVGAVPAYALFTWSTIGIIDVPSMIAITGEAWLRTPTTVIVPS